MTKYILIFSIILVIIFYCYTNFKYNEPFIDNIKKKKKKIISTKYTKNNENTVSRNEFQELRQTLIDYKRQIQQLELKLKMKGVLDDDITEHFVSKESSPEEELNLFNKKFSDHSKNLKKKINQTGKYSNLYHEELSIEEEDLIFNEDINTYKNDWGKDGNRTYQYWDKKKKREIYKIYQKGNLLTMEEDHKFDILSQHKLTLNGSYKNKVILDEFNGINIQSNTKVNIDQISETNRKKGNIRMTDEEIRIIHTDKFVLKVGDSVILMDKNSITITSPKINILSSESSSIMSNEISIDSNKSVINSNLDILGETKMYDKLDLDGSFNHQGPSFSSLITSVMPLNQIKMLNNNLLDIKEKNINLITNYQRFNNININNTLSQRNKKNKTKLDLYEDQFKIIIKNMITKVIGDLGLSGVKNNIINTEESTKLKNLTSTLIITPGKFNFSSRLSGKEGIKKILTDINKVKSETTSETFKQILSEVPIEEASNEVIKNIKNKIISLAGGKYKSKDESVIPEEKYIAEEEEVITNNIYDGLQNMVWDKLLNWEKRFNIIYTEEMIYYFQNIIDWLQKLPSVTSLSLDYDSLSLGCGTGSILSVNKDKFVLTTSTFNGIIDNLNIENKLTNLITENCNVKANITEYLGDKLEFKTNTLLQEIKDIRLKNDKIVFEKCKNIRVNIDHVEFKGESLTVESPLIKIDNEKMDFITKEINLTANNVKTEIGALDMRGKEWMVRIPNVDFYFDKEFKLITDKFRLGDNDKPVGELNFNSLNFISNTEKLAFNQNEEFMINCGEKIAGELKPKKEGYTNYTKSSILDLFTKNREHFVSEGPKSTFIINKDKIDMFTQFINMGNLSKPTKSVTITGKLSHDGDSNFKGGVTVLGDIDATGEIQATGKASVKGEVSITGKLSATTIQAPTAQITNMSGLASNATNSVNAINSTNAANAQMSTFSTNSASALFAASAPKCFSGDTKLLMFNNQFKRFSELKIGDKIKNKFGIFTINYVSKRFRPNYCYICKIDNIKISYLHPIFIDNDWYFAYEKLPIINSNIKYLYNISLKDTTPEESIILIEKNKNEKLISSVLGWNLCNSRLIRNEYGPDYNKKWGIGWKN